MKLQKLDKNSIKTKDLLDHWYLKANTQDFIGDDPICIPKSFSKLQDIEIAAFFAAILAWGQRKTIIQKATSLMQLMDNDPYQFILHHTEKDRIPFLQFKHRTFQADDVIYFLHFLQKFYTHNATLENAFIDPTNLKSRKAGLIHFYQSFTSDDLMMPRTAKHISTPAKKAACKRLNMFLRWMVRADDQMVDFGLWKQIKASELMIPLDVHVARVARDIGLLDRKQNDWTAVEELTDRLKNFDPEDPVKYDFALFYMGVKNYNHASQLDDLIN